MPVSGRIVNNVAYVTRINDASHFTWHAQHLVMLEDEICSSAYCKMSFHMSRRLIIRVILRGRGNIW